MATTNFVNGTVIEPSWLNDVDAAVYETLPAIPVDLANTADTADGDALIGVKRTESGAVATTLHNWIQNHEVSVTDFGAVGDGATDCASALASAVDASSLVRFPHSAAGYAFSTNATVTLTRDTVIDFAGQLMTSTNSKITFKGTTVATGRTLASNASRYATSITLNSGTSIQRGDLIHIVTTIEPSSDWDDPKQDLGRVSAISGATVTLDAPLNFAYNTADAGLSITVYRPVKLTLRRPKITLVASDADTTPYYPIWVEGLVDVEIESPVLSGQLPFNRTSNIYRTGILLFRCYGWKVTNPDYTALSYPIGVYGGSRNGFESNVTARYCHHAHADVGGWSSDYILDGLVSDDSYQSINTHPCFRAHARNFNVRSDYGLSNWRVCGGSLAHGRIRSMVDDTSENPQFQNTPAAVGYEYINEDADFIADHVEFECPNRLTKAAFSVRYGRTASYSHVKGHCWVGLAPGELETWICGVGNRFFEYNVSPSDERPSIEDSLVYATNKRIDVAFDGVETIASASTITPKIGTGTALVTGTTSINNITTTGFTGKKLCLIFSDVCAVADGGPGNLRLASTFSSTTNDTLTLVCDGANWFEVARSAN